MRSILMFISSLSSASTTSPPCLDERSLEGWRKKSKKVQYYLRRAIQQHLWKSRGQGKPSLFEWITIEKILKKPAVPSLLPFASSKKRMNTPWADNSITWKEEKEDRCCVPHGPARLKLPQRQHRLCAFIQHFKVVLQFSGADKNPRTIMQLNQGTTHRSISLCFKV